MQEKDLEIIEFNEKEYAIILKFDINKKTYFLLNELNNGEISDENIVLKEQAGFLLNIIDEKEKSEVQKYLLNEYKKDAN